MKSIYREPQWADISCQKEHGTLETFIFENSDGKIIYRFFKRQAGIIEGKEYFDIASYRGAEGPYIQYVKIENRRTFFLKFMEVFDTYCQKQNIVAEFAKLDPWDDYSELIKELYGASYYGNFYCTSLEKDFYRLEYNRRARRSIQKAKENGVTVQFDFSGETVGKFIELYKNTGEKYHISKYYQFSENEIQEYFQTFQECFLVNAYFENKVIASALTVMGKEIEHYLFLGIDPQYSDLQANSLMTYETALYGQQKGRKLFDMGGGTPGSGVEQFKRNFISENGIWSYFAVKKIRNHNIYEALTTQKGEIKNPNFFPLYRG